MPVLLAPLVVVAIALSPSRPPSTAPGQDVIAFYLANPFPRLLSAYMGPKVQASTPCASTTMLCKLG